MANLTARENEIMQLSWECFKTEPTVNYAKLAEAAGLNGAASATTAYLAAKKKMKASGTVKLTPRERQILAMAWKCFNSAPSVNYADLAEKAGLKNAASATTAFLSAKKKMLKTAEVEGGDGATEVKPKKAAKGKKAKSESEEADGTPPKKARKNLRTAPTPQPDDDGAEEAEAEEPAKKKRKRANAVSTAKSKAVLNAVDEADEGEENVKEEPEDEGEAEAEVAEPAKKKRKRAAPAAKAARKGKTTPAPVTGAEEDGEQDVKAEVEEKGEGEVEVEAGVAEQANKKRKRATTAAKKPAPKRKTTPAPVADAEGEGETEVKAETEEVGDGEGVDAGLLEGAKEYLKAEDEN